jgi:hypothetical protein
LLSQVDQGLGLVRRFASCFIEEVQPAHARPGAEPGEIVVADLRAVSQANIWSREKSHILTCKGGISSSAAKPS